MPDIDTATATTNTRIAIHARAVSQVLCPGCMHGPDTSTCPRVNLDERGCKGHHPGTRVLRGGLLALGFPKGFSRVGPIGEMSDWLVNGWSRFDVLVSTSDLPENCQTIFSVPVWAYYQAPEVGTDDLGITFTRWYSPRTNCGWSVAFVGDVTKDPVLARALVLDKIDIDGMD